MTKNFWSKLTLAGIGSALLGSCATIASKPSYLEMKTTPNNVDVTLQGVQERQIERDLVTPFKVELDKGTDYRVIVETENYRSEEITIDRKITGWFWGNIILGGPIGMLVDYSTDEMWTHNPDLINLDLTEARSAPDKFEVKAPIRLNYPDGTYETVFLPVEFYKKGTIQAQKQKCITSGTLPETDKNCFEVLQEWANNDDRSMRSKVAYSPNTPSEILQDLAKDDSHFVRSRVASNPNTPVKTLQKLAEDSKDSVQWEVASNPNATDGLLKKLAEDDNEAVREQAEKTLEENIGKTTNEEAANDISQQDSSDSVSESTSDALTEDTREALSKSTSNAVPESE